MPIQMPSTSDVPDGPHRRLLLAVHQLYMDAGSPGIHRTSRSIRARDDLHDTISHEAISKILRGKVIPQRWHKLEALLRQYLDESVDRPGPEDIAAAVREVQTLWYRAMEGNKADADGPQDSALLKLAAPEDAGVITLSLSNQKLLPPEEVVRQALELPEGEARSLIIDQSAHPARDPIPLVVALMSTLPEEGIRLLNLAGSTQGPKGDPYLADLIAQVQGYPADTWRGRDPLRALLRSVGKRSDYGSHLVKLLLKQGNDAAARAYLRVYAQRTDSLGAAELVQAFAEARGLRASINQFLRMVSEHTPRPLADEVPEHLRQLGRRREARLLAEMLANG
ncbi:hypothetical protein OG948_05905 [Embleya sp. NBC_00888]|uniref:hypothetical protein n=1 Tax=Embleya sp. NBC_00888 TaxID=2975960 RepID=UPI00386FD1C9|nr:hypothetical protein OG948_05905 [Embleya sp. NBC_00888]